MQIIDMLRPVLVEAEACPEGIAEEDMRSAVIQWCTETRCLHISQTVSTVSGDQEPAQIDMSAEFVVDIVSARIDGRDVNVLASNDSATKDATEAEPVLVFADPNQPYVLPPPTAPREVELYMAVSPGPDAAEVPDVLWQRYREALVNGALARVLARRGKPWSDPNEAERRRQLFERAITSTAALLGVNRVTTAQRLRVQPV